MADLEIVSDMKWIGISRQSSLDCRGFSWACLMRYPRNALSFSDSCFAFSGHAGWNRSGYHPGNTVPRVRGAGHYITRYPIHTEYFEAGFLTMTIGNGTCPMRMKRPRPVPPDGIRMSRESETTVFEYFDPSIQIVCLKIGPACAPMIDAEVFERFDSMQEARSARLHRRRGARHD